jgi:hypothetical protein
MKTKGLIFIFVLAVLAGRYAHSQEVVTGKNEIRIGYGFLTGPEMANSLMSLWPAIGIDILKDTIKDYNCSAHGAATLEYNRFLNPWISVGGSLSVNPISTLITTKHGKELTWSYYVFSVMPKIKFTYMRKQIFSMYSGFEGGCAVIVWRDRQGSTTVSDNGLSFAFQVTGFGIRVGKEIGGYMEWGFGYRGVVNFGLSARF